MVLDEQGRVVWVEKRRSQVEVAEKEAAGGIGGAESGVKDSLHFQHPLAREFVWAMIVLLVRDAGMFSQCMAVMDGCE